mmetsp:Transcript_48454/g.84395  ORF Transcript_48454/g.84395 Transcript_48454/m.84395 type:complete len:214 (-) Transcript_48454:731-1372(-)
MDGSGVVAHANGRDSPIRPSCGVLWISPDSLAELAHCCFVLTSEQSLAASLSNFFRGCYQLLGNFLLPLRRGQMPFLSLRLRLFPPWAQTLSTLQGVGLGVVSVARASCSRSGERTLTAAKLRRISIVNCLCVIAVYVLNKQVGICVHRRVLVAGACDGQHVVRINPFSDSLQSAPDRQLLGVLVAGKQTSARCRSFLEPLFPSLRVTTLLLC